MKRVVTQPFSRSNHWKIYYAIAGRKRDGKKRLRAVDTARRI
jgi:hypothetical protein